MRTSPGDRDELSTRHGRASFGVLLLQDLAVVPLNVQREERFALALVFESG